jgi:ribonucleoside-diphosphate reductase alpha chain
VEDTIEGWSDTVGLLFNSFQKGLYFEPCYDEIRPIGAKLNTGGGRAPGHLPLKKLIERVRAILHNAVGRKLRSIECHDIICHIAEAVLAGGIRRSSLIALFSKDDLEMLSCKTPEHFNYNGLNKQRQMANNSVVFLRSDTTKDEFMHLMSTNRKTYGEPGFMFTNHLDWGTNPCGEIGIDPTLAVKDVDGRPMSKETGFGFCNLAEINVAACESEDDFLHSCEDAAFIATLQAAYTDFPYLGEVTEQIVKRDALIGVGLTGIMDNPSVGLNAKLLEEGVDFVVQENARVAELIGIESAARCTTVKPSGTASLELGCIGSGIHPHHAPRYFRRITANAEEPVVNYFMQFNPHMVEKKPDGDYCITFPVAAPKEAKTLKDTQSTEFMRYIFGVYDAWVKPGTAAPGVLTHNISATVVVEDDMWDAVLNLAWDNRARIRAMSFFPKFGDKGIPYIPREEVTEIDVLRWQELIKNYKPVDYTQMNESEDTTDLRSEVACSGGACELVHTERREVADGSIYFTQLAGKSKDYLFVAEGFKLGSVDVFKAIFSPAGTKVAKN